MPGAQRIIRIYRTLAILLLNTVMVVVLVEIGATVLLALSSGESAEPPLAEQIETFKQKQLSLSYYRDQEWSRAYWDEHMQVVDHWDYSPYIIWRTRPFSGAFINVNADSIRDTPGATCTADAFRIFMFGGSTMWGFGAPDWGTIPAYLQAALTEQGQDVCVTNYADVAFNSTQSLIKLILELQRGNVPDMVIFYDGANDVTIANLTGEAGTHFYLDEIENAVQGNLAFGSVDSVPSSPLIDLLRQTATFRLARQIINSAGSNEAGPPLTPSSPAFADSIVDVYLTNVRATNLLADDYGFDFIAFWQPVLEMREGPVSDEEQRFLWEMPGNLPELFRAVYGRMDVAALDLDYIHNLSDVLDNSERSIWIDFNHLSSVGNALVADAMLDVVMTYLQ